jgi:riboflavin kinase/FMN adenylyltransferase
VATIGVFDGVHLGHQRILDRVHAAAARLGLPSLVFSFEPTPQEVMNPGQAPARLMCLREKVLALEESGVGYLYCPPFDRKLQGLAPPTFIEQLLVCTLGVKHLVVGDDFRFGKGRAGTFSHLEAGGRQHGFGVEQVSRPSFETYVFNMSRIPSLSSAIRIYLFKLNPSSLNREQLVKVS